MKCDDDTFVRLDVVLKQISVYNRTMPLYMGNLNLLHRPLRHGKWAVTYEEWPEFVYPPYANGPGYVISIDIARDIVSRHANHSLRVRLILKLHCTHFSLHIPLMLSDCHLTGTAVVQDGRCEHGHVGRRLQHHRASSVHSQLEVLPVRLRA
jgi:hypothetical protein